MKYLILLNRKFPYKYGEAFLENEIDEISEYFDQVLLFPSNMTSKDEVTREIKSKNVEVYAVAKHSLKSRNIAYCIGGLFAEKDKEAKTIKNKLYAGYFEFAAETQADAIWKVLKKKNFSESDEIIIYSYWLFVSAKVALLIKKHIKNEISEKIKVKCVSRAHAFDVYEDRRYLPCRKELFAELDRVFPCSSYGTEYLKERHPDSSDKIRTSYLGTYDKGVEDRRREKVIHIVSCSRLDPPKRMDLMIDGLKKLKDDGIEYSWTHFGGGEGFEHLEDRAHSELQFMEVTLAGRISNANVYEYYRTNHYDLFLNTSEMEGLPVSIMEASSFGIPIVATDVGGTGEIVANDVSGKILSKTPTPDEIASAIHSIAVMDDPDYICMRENARHIWENKFNAKENYKEFAMELNALL